MTAGLVHDRRRNPTWAGGRLPDQLNRAQCDALALLQRFGWELRFVRTPLGAAALPVVFDRDNSFVVIRPDGSIDDYPALLLRR